ncbi:MAG: glycosyltransferase family 2 protein [Hyphomicrobiaceae bacterium]|nr:glycosyltransferase family 2 protein [Hyphomicrobiaceae bacterium]
MWASAADGYNFLTSQSWVGILGLFWFTLVFDIPRYALAFVAAAFFGRVGAARTDVQGFAGRVSVVIAGHNEADAIERCVKSFQEQSRPPDEIVVVSDGSTDGMENTLRELQRRGAVDQVHCTHLRAGKSAACNLGERYATGEIIVIADCDCTYERHALKEILAPFEDPAIGAVSGNILVRNASETLIATFTAIEYLISISLGKQAAALTDHVTCVSGAFGAFRKTALDQVQGNDVGGGEDLDMTLRLRKAGWKIAFEPDSICYTDTPATFSALVRQRFRWERDAVRIRYRKHADLMNPFSANFQLHELYHEVEFLIFHILGAILLPVYVIWLFLAYGEMAVVILLSVQIGLFSLDLLSFILAAWATPKANSLGLLPYTFGYSFFNGFVMRNVRLAAYLQEWLFNASAEDEYLPQKVRLTRRW